MLNRKRAEYADTSRKYVKVTSHASPNVVECTFGRVYWPQVQYGAARLGSIQGTSPLAAAQQKETGTLGIRSSDFLILYHKITLKPAGIQARDALLTRWLHSDEQPLGFVHV